MLILAGDFEMMKSELRKILIAALTAVFVLGGCGGANQPIRSNEALKSPSNDTNKEKLISAKGKVTQIQRGKDGYTAEIKADDGKTYSAVISSVNLAGSGRYKEVKIGDLIEVKGEDVLGDGSTIKVTDLK